MIKDRKPLLDCFAKDANKAAGRDRLVFRVKDVHSRAELAL